MAAPDVEVRLGIEYANHDGVALLGDLYTPAAPGAYPTLLLIHGGAWKMGTRAGYQYWGPYLARRGYAAFAVDYRLATPRQPMYPQNVHDVHRHAAHDGIRQGLRWRHESGRRAVKFDRRALAVARELQVALPFEAELRHVRVSPGSL